MDGTGSEVLVAGAGPTGLLSACLLRRLGIDTRIVDQRPRPDVASGSVMVSSRSLELLASIGLAGRLQERGRAMRRVDVHAYGARVASVRLDPAFTRATAWPFMLMLPQAEIEAALIDALEASGEQVEWGVRVTSVEQDLAGVRVRTRHDGLGDSTLHAAWLLGADGSESVVRRAIGLGFEAAGRPHRMLVGEALIEGLPDPGHAHLFLDGERVGMVLPLAGETRCRVMTLDLRMPEVPGFVDGPAGGEPLALAELQQAFSQVVGGEVVLRDPAWLRRFEGHQRRTDRRREGRVLVAGDAARFGSPAIGQGVDAGLMDAANLAWKLAAVLKGGVDDALLDTFEAERSPVAHESQQFADQLLGLADGRAGWRGRARMLLAPRWPGDAFGLEGLQEVLLRRFGQFDLAYPPNRYLDGESSGRPPRPGERAPDARLPGGSRVLDLLAGYRFALLALSRRPLSPGDLDRAEGALAVLREAGAVTCLVAQPATRAPACPGSAEPAEVHGRYGLADEDAQALVLLRPDGQVAWCAESFDWMACARALAALGAGR